MRKVFYLFIFFTAIHLFSTQLFAQSFIFERAIMVTDTVTDDEEGFTFAASSDDAEQENDAIDALFDDDLDAGWEGAADDQNILTCGLRFRNITVPKDARIDSAFIVLTSHEGKSADDVARITIYGEASDDAATYSEDSLISDRPRTVESLLWEVNIEWELWGVYQTPDVGAIVEEVITRPGWEAGNAIAFAFAGEDQGPSDLDNAREFESFENISDPDDGGDGQNHPERVPKLVIYYTMESASGGLVDVRIMVTDTVTDEDEGFTFAASSDDAEQENDEIDALFDDDLDAGWEGAADDQNILTTGLRFRNIEIPPGSVIDSAFIEFCSHEGKSADDIARITIAGEAADNPATYTEDSLISDRPQTTAQILWEVAEEWGLWEFYRTPDLKDIIQEIVDRDGWDNGNAMAFLLKGEDQGPSDLDNAREFESFENIADPDDGGDGQNHPERVPRLLIYFSSATTGIFDVDGGYESLNIFPNPNPSPYVNLELPEQKSFTAEIFNLNGEIVKRIEDQGHSHQIFIGNMASGTYLIRVVQGSRKFAQKMIIH